MKDISLLDCTIRDGGYYTNWDFDRELIKKHIQYIDKLPIEYIEIGYRSKPKKGYLGEYFYLPVSTLQNIRKYTKKKLVVMINAKDCIGVDLSELLLDVKGFVSLIRVATDPNQINQSIEIAKELNSMGFSVALNIMYISSINTSHAFFDRLKNIDKFVQYLYLVDSYGSIYPSDLKNLIQRIQSKTSVTLGFHGHNNLELSFINSLVAIKNGVKLIDSTILGIGRGAGNLKTELILVHLKSSYNFNVNLKILADATENFRSLFRRHQWGVNLAYIVSGKYSLSQKEVMNALEVDRYSLSEIVTQLKDNHGDDFPVFQSNDVVNNCIIIGGGCNVDRHFDAIYEFLFSNQDILVIHSTSKYIELFSSIKNIQIIGATGKEFVDANSKRHISKFILDPSPRKINTDIKNTENIFELKEISFVDKFFDSPLAISLQISLDNFLKIKELNSLTPSQYNGLGFQSIYELIIHGDNAE
jgi:4-hydroxy 2-oxovalerate aldolase